MRLFIIFITSMLSITSGFSQQTKKEQSKEPKAEWRVNREYDKDGNLIAYDSVYVKSYSHTKLLNQTDLDSLFQKQADFFKNFKMPEMNLSDLDSIRLDMNRFFRGFEMPDFDQLHLSPPDSLRQQHPFFKQFIPEHFDMQKEMELMKQEFDKMRQAFEKNQQQQSSSKQYKEKSL